MYCDYYGFREKPFNITPDPGFIFLSAHHNEAFAHLLYGIDNHVGFIALTGEVGAGKTTVIRTLLGQLSRDQYRTALIFNPCLSSLGLMQTINREYGLPADHTDTADLFSDLNRFLLEENIAGRTVVLVVDEAQNLESMVLEQIRLISNLETEQDKLIQIVLVGQPELRELLARPELRQLGQRIGVNYHLRPMTLADTRDYITHRMEVAGRNDSTLFTPGAVQRIYRFSGGLPRLINLACDRALLLGYTSEQSPLTAKMAGIAIADIRLTPEGRFRSRPLSTAVVALLLLTLFCSGLFLITRQVPLVPETPRRVTTTPAVPPAQSAPLPLSVSTMARDLAGVGEKENALAVFNVLARIWHVSPANWASPQPELPEALARERGLESLKLSGSNLETLLKFNSPAILELALPGVTGRRYLALTGSYAGRYTIAPPLAGRTTLSKGELEGIWTGRAYLPWKNHLEIPSGIKAGIRGRFIRRLQTLLQGAGFYKGPLTGIMDRPTQDAVKSFQISRGIETDGTVGRKTLVLLYRSGTAFPNPTLAHDRGTEK
jgi:general secretion pathway protein A